MVEKKPIAKKTEIYRAETLDGRAVLNLRPFESGWIGFVDGLKMIWDLQGTTGKGNSWTLQNIRSMP